MQQVSSPATSWRDSALAQEIDFLVVKAFAQGTRDANRRLATLGLRVRSYSVLSIACEDVAPTQRDLADFLVLDPSQVVALVDGLESAGLVQRVVDPNDRRSRVVRATDAGREVFAQAQQLVAGTERELLRGLGDEDRESLRRLLRTIIFGAD